MTTAEEQESEGGSTPPARKPMAGGQGATMVIIGALFVGAVLVYLLQFVLGIGR